MKRGKLHKWLILKADLGIEEETPPESDDHIKVSVLP